MLAAAQGLKVTATQHSIHFFKITEVLCRETSI